MLRRLLCGIQILMLGTGAALAQSLDSQFRLLRPGLTVSTFQVLGDAPFQTDPQCSPSDSGWSSFVCPNTNSGWPYFPLGSGTDAVGAFLQFTLHNIASNTDPSIGSAACDQITPV